MIRSLILTGVFLGFAPVALLAPIAGLLLWGWLTFMHPEQLVYGFGHQFRFNFLVAAYTLFAWFISREPKLPPLTAINVLLVAFIAWMIVAQANSLRPDHSWPYFDRFFREMVFVAMVAVMVNNKARIHALLWIYAISICFFSVKSGVFTLVTGGVFRVWGPPRSMIADNNQVGLAMASAIPLLEYLRLHSANRALRYGLAAAIGLTLVATLGTYSRGAFIALVVAAIFMMVKSRHRLFIAVVGLMLVAAFMFMPEPYDHRVETIRDYQTEASFQGRVDAWRIAVHLASSHPLTGVGFRVPYLQEVVDQWMPGAPQARAGHSIYFEVLGSMGFVGLFLYLAICAVAWRSGRGVVRHSRGRPELKWAEDLAAMLQVSLASFLVGGASMSMEFWPGNWTVMVLLANLRYMIARHPSPAEDRRPVGYAPSVRRPEQPWAGG